MIEDDDHLLTVLRHIEANPLRVRLVADAGDYRWSSFAAHGRGQPDALLDGLIVYDELARTASTRLRRWTSFVHQSPSEEELSALRRSNTTGLPFGSSAWVERLGKALDLDLTIRPRGRPRKVPAESDGSKR